MHLLPIQNSNPCKNDDGRSSIIEYRKLFHRWEYKHNCTQNELIFIMSGSCYFSFDTLEKQYIRKGESVLLSSGTCYTIKNFEPLSFIICYLNSYKDFFPIHLADSNMQFSNYYILNIHSKIEEFLYNLINIINDGLVCNHFFELKIKELSLLLNRYYEKEVLCDYFRIPKDSCKNFNKFIHENYKKIHTIEEFAALGKYNTEDFIKIFTHFFGIPPQEWLLRKKAEQLIQDIEESDKSLNEICKDYGFATLSSFNSFCKTEYGISVGKLRNKRNKP